MAIEQQAKSQEEPHLVVVQAGLSRGRREACDGKHRSNTWGDRDDSPQVAHSDAGTSPNGSSPVPRSPWGPALFSGLPVAAADGVARATARRVTMAIRARAPGDVVDASRQVRLGALTL